MMKILTKTGKIVISVLLAMLVAWAAFTVIGKIVNPTKYPMLFGYSEAGIASGSMEPTISQGDHVVFHRQDTYELDDVVVFYDEIDGIFVVHRIVGKSGDKFIVQGDYNPECDPNPVKLENIQGKVIFAVENVQPFLYIGFGSLVTILIQMLCRDIKRLKNQSSEEGGNQNEEQDIQNS